MPDIKQTPYRATNSVLSKNETRKSAAAGLERWHFTRIAERGFGDPLNAYPHSMAWFKGKLYVGTTRANICLIKARVPLFMDCWPVKCPENVYDLDLRAQIWCYDPLKQEWQQAHVSPFIIGRQGDQVPREIGYRSMAVFQGPSDPEPVLYVATWAPIKALGPLILRSVDGDEFVPVSEPGLGDETVASFRSFVPFNGRLFIAPTGRVGGKPNTPDTPVILESTDPVRGEWCLATTPGFGDPSNLAIFEMVVFNNFLYAGTLNPSSGYQVWKTRADGKPPYHWTKVITAGAYRGPFNEAVLSMKVFGDALYVGSCILNGGYDVMHRVGPSSPELIRLFPDDTWELIVGEPRTTPQGFKHPLSGFGPGFGNFFNGYFWRMAEFEGMLYLGTFDWSILLPYLQIDRFGDRGKRLVRWLRIENLVKFEGGFDLFRSRDGICWAPITTNGFDNPIILGYGPWWVRLMDCLLEQPTLSALRSQFVRRMDGCICQTLEAGPKSGWVPP